LFEREFSRICRMKTMSTRDAFGGRRVSARAIGLARAVNEGAASAM